MRRSVLLIFLLISLFAEAQYFTTGEDPASLRWRQLSTDHFRLIYPLHFEEKAQQMAQNFEKVYRFNGYSLNHNPRKISVIFHTQTVRSNGLVAWAPRRMELFTPPHQDIYAQDWLEQLALHEFRHVVQVDKVASHVPFFVKALLGEQGIALITGLYLPFWFLEGDAVVAETALSTSGRGRLPSFLMEEKAQVVNKGVFSFEKAYLGSYKDYVPDHYKLGYFLVGESRAKFGNNMWSKAIETLARKPFSINPVEKVVKQSTGLNQRDLYASIFNGLQDEWLREDHSYIPGNYNAVTAPLTEYTNYRYNHFLKTGEMISLKSGFEQIPAFIRIDEKGNEKVITIPGQIFEESVSYRNNLITWSEFVPDPRWEHSGKSILRIYDIEKRELRSITPEFKCFAPSISPDEHNVAVVEADFSNHYYLSVYDVRSGALISRFKTSENNYFFNPVWKDNSSLYAVVLNREGKKIAMINPFNHEIIILITQDLGEIKHLYPQGDKLFFISSYAGKNELYSLTIGDGSLRREVTARFGIESPAFSEDGKSLLVSDYTADGYRLIRIYRDKLHGEPIFSIQKANYVLAESLAKQERGVVDFTPDDSTRYISKPYRKGLLNFHSWEPFTFDINTYEFQPGISFLSQNLLGTNVTSLGYKWNLTENAGQTFVNYEYRGLYPVFSVELTNGKRAGKYSIINVYHNQAGAEIRRDTVTTRYSWDQTTFSLDMRMPLNLTRGRYYRMLQPELKYGIIWNGYNKSTPEKIELGNLNTMVFRLYYHQLLRQSLKDIQPGWGFVVDGTYRYTPGGDYDLGLLKSLQLVNYWPGFMKNHGFSTYAGFQMRQGVKDKYSFGDVISMPRGTQRIDNNKLFRSSVAYSMPLMYPDWNLGKLVYLKRIKATLFYDFAWMERNRIQNGNITGTFTEKISSVGLDLSGDANFMRFYAPANVGLRTIYLPQTGKFVFGFLYSVDFTSF
jgi:hypothetical protein